MGILSLLDEECLFPQASDKSFLEKLTVNHAGKTTNYIKAQFKAKDRTEGFGVAHYAGTVSHSLRVRTVLIVFMCKHIITFMSLC